MILLLIVIGIAGELYRLLTSDERLTLRLLIGRLLLGGLASLAVLVARVHNPDLEDITLIGLASIVAVLGYSFLEKPLKEGLRTIFNSFVKRSKGDDNQ